MSAAHENKKLPRILREMSRMAENDSSMRNPIHPAMQAQRASLPVQAKRSRPRLGAENLADTIACLVAIFLCLVNALVWAFISGLPIVGVLWVVAAAACLKLRAWTRG
ncbi:MAG: hypothetical protein ABWY07_13675 [Burkholderiales bacterium]